MELLYVIIDVLAYFFIGGLINGIVKDSDDEVEFGAVIFWPIFLFIVFGDWIGRLIKRAAQKMR